MSYQPLLFSGFVIGQSSGGGSGATIGGPVTGGTDKSVLFIHPNGTLAQDNANFNYNSTTHQLTITGNLNAATFNSYTPENLANKGIANGYAPLDGAGKVPYTNLPSALMTFKGAWDPTTNTPTLTNGVGLTGDTYRASVSGASTSPIVDTWFAGDFIIYNGTIWQRSPLADGVISVNGLTGAVILTRGNLTDSTAGADGISVTNGTNSVWGSGTSIAQLQSSGSQNGYLSSTDWTTFNNKQISGNYITALTGDVTASGPGSAIATLVTVNGNVGSFGSSTSIPNFTVNGKGLITIAGSNVVIAPAGTLTGTTLAANVVSSSLTSVGTLTTGVWNGTTIAIANGGTGQTTSAAAFNSLNPMTTTGDLIYESATNISSRLPIGTSGQVLTVTGGIPTWVTSTVGANQQLSNLSSTAINTDLIGGPGVTFSLKTFDEIATGSQQLTVSTGIGPVGFTSGALILSSGDADQDSGGVDISTGTSGNTNSGSISLTTGTASNGVRGVISFSASGINFTTETNLDIGGKPISNLQDPTNPQDAATKAYVDTNAPVVSIGDINQTSFSAAASQTGQPVTGFAFANGSVRSFKALVSVSTASSLFAEFNIQGIQKSASWELSQDSLGDSTTYVFSIDNTGQVLYTSGATTATIKFRAIVTNV